MTEEHGNQESSEKVNPKYQIENPIGKGGMGVVYSARDLNFQRTVAMKVLLDHHQKEDIARFVEEAQITSQLEHPNIIPVHEIGRDADGNIFYTMKYVQGVTLTEVLNAIRQGDPDTIEQFPLGRLLTIFQKTCDAVAFAHSKGVVHHDLKPGNIMIGDYGEVLVLDWGLARLINSSRIRTMFDVPMTRRIQFDSNELSSTKALRLATTDSTQRVEVPDDLAIDSIHTDKIGSGLRTLHGRIMGTPAFMAPEQVQQKGAQIDERTDIYSLGAILYSILTLRPPISGGNLKDVLTKIVNSDFPAPKSFNKNSDEAGTDAGGAIFALPHCPNQQIPAALSDVVMKAMSKLPDERYPSVQDLQRDVEAFQDGLIWNLVVDEDLSTPDFESRWEIWGGHHEWKPGELRLYGGEPQFLLFKKPLAGDVRIEFECRQESADLTDVSCFLSAIPSEHWQETPSSGYQFKYGGYSNSANVLERSSQPLWRQPASPLLRGKTYRVCAERVGARLKLTVNRDEIFSVTDSDPLSGSDRTAVGILGSMTDTRYTRIRIYCLGHPWKADVLDIAERQLQNGHYVTAMDLFKEVIDSFPDKKRLEKAQRGYEAAKNRDHMRCSLPVWREKLAKAWPTSVINLRMDNDGLTVDISGAGITDLEPLQGMPLTALYCSNNHINSLEPLRGMPLGVLNCGINPISSLEPLRGMPLNNLLCEGCPVTSLEPLRGAPLTMLNCGGAALGENGLEPLRGMKLTWLCCWSSGLSNLDPLKGMPLTALYCDGNEIESLEPLRGMPLGRLICSSNRIVSLEPLQGMSLTTLHCAHNKIVSLEPLRGMSLSMLSCQCNEIASLEPLRGTTLGVLTCGCNKLANIGCFVKNPPETFFFECDSIPASELDWVRQAWSRDFRWSQHARNIEVLLALRNNNTERLKSLAREFQGHRYLFIPKFMKWEEARECCERLGGHLVTITSKEENDFVTALRPSGNWFWLGLKTTANGHEWVTGEKFTYGTFVDPLREQKIGGKIFCSGTLTSEVDPDVSNCFMIEWDSA
jgi:serine/threonine protein kinase/Leucine-rich repeat (LRR) protein